MALLAAAAGGNDPPSPAAADTAHQLAGDCVHPGPASLDHLQSGERAPAPDPE